MIIPHRGRERAFIPYHPGAPPLHFHAKKDPPQRAGPYPLYLKARILYYWRRRLELNTGMKVLRTYALTLGYVAVLQNCRLAAIFLTGFILP